MTDAEPLPGRFFGLPFGLARLDVDADRVAAILLVAAVKIPAHQHHAAVMILQLAVSIRPPELRPILSACRQTCEGKAKQ
ncbi:MAG: hypothetical protein N2A42_00235 [Luteolibacter sp.]